MRRSDYPYRRRDDESLRGDYPPGDYSDRGRRSGDDYPRGDDDYLRRSPNRQYGSNDQGYSDLPAHERNERLRHLSSRHGNPERRLPREVPRGTWGEGGRPDEKGWACMGRSGAGRIPHPGSGATRAAIRCTALATHGRSGVPSMALNVVAMLAIVAAKGRATTVVPMTGSTTKSARAWPMRTGST